MKEKQILNVLPGTVRRQVEREELRYDLLQEIRPESRTAADPDLPGRREDPGTEAVAGPIR